MDLIYRLIEAFNGSMVAILTAVLAYFTWLVQRAQDRHDEVYALRRALYAEIMSNVEVTQGLIVMLSIMEKRNMTPRDVVTNLKLAWDSAIQDDAIRIAQKNLRAAASVEEMPRIQKIAFLFRFQFDTWEKVLAELKTDPAAALGKLKDALSNINIQTQDLLARALNDRQIPLRYLPWTIAKWIKQCKINEQITKKIIADDPTFAEKALEAEAQKPTKAEKISRWLIGKLSEPRVYFPIAFVVGIALIVTVITYYDRHVGNKEDRVVSQVVEVEDVNTIKVEIEDGIFSIHIIGIQPPVERVVGAKEKGPISTLYAAKSLLFAYDILASNQIIVEKDPVLPDRDSEGRLLRHVKFLDGSLFALKAIREGYACVDSTLPTFAHKKVLVSASRLVSRNLRHCPRIEG